MSEDNKMDKKSIEPEVVTKEEISPVRKLRDELNEKQGRSDYPCPDGYDPERWATKSDDHKRAVINLNNRKGGSS